MRNKVTTVSTTDLAPQCASSQNEETEVIQDLQSSEEDSLDPASSTVLVHPGITEIETSPETVETEPAALRRSTRRRNAVDRYGMVPYM